MNFSFVFKHQECLRVSFSIEPRSNVYLDNVRANSPISINLLVHLGF